MLAGVVLERWEHPALTPGFGGVVGDHFYRAELPALARRVVDVAAP